MASDKERFVTEGFTHENLVDAWIKTTRCSCSFCGADTISIDILQGVEPDPAPATAEREEGEE